MTVPHDQPGPDRRRVRPYAMTGGRTRPTHHDLEIEALVSTLSVGFDTRDTALTWLVGRAQAEGGAWLVGLAGVLLPGIGRRVYPLCRAFPRLAPDLEAEALVGLLQAVQTWRLGEDRVATRLVWAAARGAHRLLRRETAVGDREASVGLRLEPPPRPPAHGELLLAQAVASVSVPAGATSARFTVTTSAVATSTPVTITASAGGVVRTTTLTVNPLGQSATLTVTATGRGGERITSNPAGINVVVGSTGSASFAVATSITLSATNGRDVIWSGLFQRREQDQDLHLHPERQRQRDRQRPVAR